MVAIPLSPHADANMYDTFMTAYNKDFPPYSVSSNGSPLNSLNATGSGHTSNRVLFCKPPSTFNPTTYGTHYEKHDRSMSEGQWRSVCGDSLKPQVHCTAFVRDTSHVGRGRNELATISTMKASYPNQRPQTVHTLEGACMYSGNGTSQFTSNFLHIASLPSDTGASTIGKTTCVTDGLIDPHPGRRNLTHSSMLPGTYFQHSKLIGDRTLALPGQLPVPLAEATDFESTKSSSSSLRSMLDTLSGRRTPSAPASTGGIVSKFQTNPLPMSPPEQDACAVSRRIENQGHVKGSTYQGHFINQRNLPELSDPSKQRRAKTAVVLHDVKPQLHQTLTLTDARGVLLSQKPKGLHPTVWNRLKAAEKTLSVDKADPHAHKLRSLSTR